MKRLAATVLALALSAASGSALANHDNPGYGYGGDDRYDRDHRYDDRYGRAHYEYAHVVRVDPILARGGNCRDDRRYRDRDYRDDRYYRNGNNSRANGAALGAVIGGALGNQAGKGDGRKAATIGGAVIGGAIGNNMDRNNDATRGGYEYRDNSGVVRRCRTVNDYQRTSDVVTGYDVTYRYAGQTYRAVTTRRPGRTMRVAVEVRPLDF